MNVNTTVLCRSQVSLMFSTVKFDVEITPLYHYHVEFFEGKDSGWFILSDFHSGEGIFLPLTQQHALFAKRKCHQHFDQAGSC